MKHLGGLLLFAMVSLGVLAQNRNGRAASDFPMTSWGADRLPADVVAIKKELGFEPVNLKQSVGGMALTMAEKRQYDLAGSTVELLRLVYGQANGDDSFEVIETSPTIGGDKTQALPQAVQERCFEIAIRPRDLMTYWMPKRGINYCLIFHRGIRKDLRLRIEYSWPQR